MSDKQSEANRTISEINAMVRGLVEVETIGHPFWIGGIVKSFYLSDMGHIYFNLEDDGYSIRCMVADKVRGTLDFLITKGMELEVFGSIRVYEKRAQVQISVETAKLIPKAGITSQDSVIVQLRQKGIYPKEKRPLPDMIRTIALITSKHSEAQHDFYNTYQAENGNAVVNLRDVLLQGKRAAQQIADAIQRTSNQKEADVIVLVRGGGRQADLATFNNLLIAEAICRSEIPVVTGIGHQRDDTIADRVADHVAITPTAAATFLARASQLIPSQKAIQSNSNRNLYYVIVIMIAIIIALSLILLTNSL